MEPASPPERLASTRLQPFASFVLLHSEGPDPGRDFTYLRQFLRERAVKRRNGIESKIVSSGIDDVDDLRRHGFDEWDFFVIRRTSSPSWTDGAGRWIDEWHDLVIALRRGTDLVIHAPSRLRDALASWLRLPTAPRLVTVNPEILHGAFLRGETRGLSLRDTRRRSTKPKSKTISGTNLRNALSPFEDSSYTFGTARAVAPERQEGSTLTGNIGTTPRRGLVWNKTTESLHEFLAIASTITEIVNETISSGTTLDRPFDVLASELHDTSQAIGAFEVSILDPNEVGDETNEEAIEAAELLAKAYLNVIPGGNSSSFDLEIGRSDGAVAAVLRVSLKSMRRQMYLDYAYKPAGSLDPAGVQDIVTALRTYDLLTVYYENGVTYLEGGLHRQNETILPFTNWRFESLKNHALNKEKPDTKVAQIIHDSIDMSDEDSLFNWVFTTYSAGWLTCDDGAGEIADFVHLSPEGHLSLIHVKGANSTSRGRRVALNAYELVVSQATKNVECLFPSILLDRLERSPVERPACWVDGNRVGGRSELIEAAQCRKADDPSFVVVVQPHVHEEHYRSVRDGNPAGADWLRLRLLDNLLNSARSSITGLNADLLVIGSR